MWATFSRERGVFALPSMVNGEQGNTERKYGGFWQPHSTRSCFRMLKENTSENSTSERRLHTAALVQVATRHQPRAPPLHSTLVLHHVLSWTHLDHLLFHCVPVTWVCLSSYITAYFLFSPAFGIAETADSSGKNEVWAAERHPENQSPPSDLDRKIIEYPPMVTNRHRHDGPHQFVITLHEHDLTGSLFTMLCLGQQFHRWGFILAHGLSLCGLHGVWVFSKFSSYLSKSK